MFPVVWGTMLALLRVWLLNGAVGQHDPWRGPPLVVLAVPWPQVLSVRFGQLEPAVKHEPLKFSFLRPLGPVVRFTVQLGLVGRGPLAQPLGRRVFAGFVAPLRLVAWVAAVHSSRLRAALLQRPLADPVLVLRWWWVRDLLRHLLLALVPRPPWCLPSGVVFVWLPLLYFAERRLFQPVGRHIAVRMALSFAYSPLLGTVHELWPVQWLLPAFSAPLLADQVPPVLVVVVLCLHLLGLGCQARLELSPSSSTPVHC